MFENGTFAVLGPDGKQVQCDVLFTYCLLYTSDAADE